MVAMVFGISGTFSVSLPAKTRRMTGCVFVAEGTSAHALFSCSDRRYSILILVGLIFLYGKIQSLIFHIYRFYTRLYQELRKFCLFLFCEKF